MQAGKLAVQYDRQKVRATFPRRGSLVGARLATFDVRLICIMYMFDEDDNRWTWHSQDGIQSVV